MSTGKYFEGGSPANYVIGGTRALFNRLIDDTVTPARYRGFRDIGNVKAAPAAPERDKKDHFSNRLGKRINDRTLTREIGDDITLTFDELSAENMFNYLKSADMVDVAGSAGNAITDEVQQMVVTGELAGEVAWLEGFTPAAIVVKDITATTTFVLNTDYEVIDSGFGYKGIRVKAGGASAIANGDFVRVNYTYTIRPHRALRPSTQEVVQGKLTLFSVSENGPEFIRVYQKVQIESEGSLDTKPDDWSDFQLKIKVLDDSIANPTMPWGLFEYYGVGAKIYNGL